MSKQRKEPKLLRDVGRRVKGARMDAGLGLREFADEAGISPSNVSWIENGKSEMGIGTLRDLCVALAVSADVLLGLRKP